MLPPASNGSMFIPLSHRLSTCDTRNIQNLLSKATLDPLIVNENQHIHPPGAISLRNLVSGYECGRVFPAGVGPCSPTGYVTKWMPSQLSRLVETQRRYDSLRGCSQVRTSSELQHYALREVVARERQGTLSRRAW